MHRAVCGGGLGGGLLDVLVIELVAVVKVVHSRAADQSVAAMESHLGTEGPHGLYCDCFVIHKHAAIVIFFMMSGS